MGANERVTLRDIEHVLDEPPETLIALDEALTAFAEIDPENARIVELRCFGGLTIQEVASLQGVSTRTIDRGWRVGLAWIRSRVEEE